jgi:hypothetical protein
LAPTSILAARFDQTYEDWRERLVQTLSVIDMDENLDNDGNPI